MSEPIWREFFSERDRALFDDGALGPRMGFGERPALLVIDVNWAFCGDKPEPVQESSKRWRNSCGQEAWDALPRISELIDRCHAKGVPVIYTTGIRRQDDWDAGAWSFKASRNGAGKAVSAPDRDPNEIVTAVAPAARDIVVYKHKPSGFFGTPLESHLNLLGCDSLIVVGGVTSGCIRATVTDGFSLNYRVAVAQDGCFDRSQASHAINLWDMSRQADVLETAEILEFLDTLPADQYELPRGNETPETGARVTL